MYAIRNIRHYAPWQCILIYRWNMSSTYFNSHAAALLNAVCARVCFLLNAHSLTHSPAAALSEHYNISLVTLLARAVWMLFIRPIYHFPKSRANTLEIGAFFRIHRKQIISEKTWMGRSFLLRNFRRIRVDRPSNVRRGVGPMAPLATPQYLSIRSTNILGK